MSRLSTAIKSRISGALRPKPRLRNWVIDPAAAPWYDGPDAAETLERRRAAERLSDADYELLRKWVADGYCVVKGVVPRREIDQMQRDLDAIWTADRPVRGLEVLNMRLKGGEEVPAMPHERLLALDPAEREWSRDTSRWRIHAFNKFSESARAIFENRELARLCALIFGRPARPGYTINFMYGSEQPLHQDTAVFNVMPPNYLIGAWIACEDVTEDAGPLVLYPKSHREPLFDKFDNYPQTNLRTAPPQVMDEYHEHVARTSERYERLTFLPEKGDALLWHGMIIHGGSALRNPERTRRSYVIHYVPPGMDVSEQVVGPFNW
jgi:phytanoyl-CoA hydroxylase